MLRIGVVGDLDRANETHLATDLALAHSASALGTACVTRWIGTEEVAASASCLDGCECLVLAPGSPYRDMAGALSAVAYSRTHGVPMLGTCGGFQHIVIEIARDVLGYGDAGHAETHPDGDRLVIVPVACAVKGQALPVHFCPGSRAATAYGELSAIERYYCSFELNAAYADELAQHGLQVTGTGPDGEARTVELDGHPFLVGTLFVPQVGSTADRPHPLVNALLRAGLERCGAPQS